MAGLFEEMDESMDVADLRMQLDTLRMQGVSAVREFEMVTEKYEKVLGHSTESYEQLLAKYMALQESYDQVKMATEGDENADPYVIVLVDAHSHKFRGDLVRGMNNGGSQAAKLLTEAVRQYLPKTRQYRIIARVYANMKGLSQDAVKAGVVQNNQGGRVLGSFAVGFSREDALFDFTDVGEQQAVESKIVELFKFHVKNPQCKAVLLGACCSSGYMRMLEAYSVFYEKVCLIQGNLLDGGMLQLPLKRVVFSQVFCSNNPNGAAVELPAEPPLQILKSEICWSYQKEGCFRHNCKFKHIRVSPDPQTYPSTPASTPPLVASLPKRTRTPKPYTPSAVSRGKNTRSPPQEPFFAQLLPKDSITGLIPINAHGQRLDLYMRAPTSTQWAAYETRIYTKKPCNAFHLYHACDDDACLDDHAPLSPDVYYCLQYVMRGVPCGKGGSCRVLVCWNGHVCQDEGCVPMKHDECPMPMVMHDMDLTLNEWVKPETREERKKGKKKKKMEEEEMMDMDWVDESRAEAAAAATATTATTTNVVVDNGWGVRGGDVPLLIDLMD